MNRPINADATGGSGLGIQTYGLLPVQLPDEIRFMELIRAEDLPIPSDTLELGTRAIPRLLERMDRAPQ